MAHRAKQRALAWFRRYWNPSRATPDGRALPEHWYKADAGTWQDAVGGTAAAADGDPVGVWEDQTANQDDVSQAVAGSKPALRLAVKNGMPVLRFDGTADYLQGPFTTGGAIAQPLTVFAVAQLDATAVNDDAYHILLDSDDNTNRMLLGTDTVPAPDVWRIEGGASLTGSATDSDWNIWTVLFNGITSQFWHSGVSEAAGNAGADNPDGVTVGANWTAISWWKGDVAEVIIYASNLSNADKNQVGRYLSLRYGIPYMLIG